MDIELRSPKDERSSLLIPEEICDLSTSFNGSVCANSGDEYEIRNNILNLTGDSEANGERSIVQSANQWRITASVYEDVWRNRSLTLLTGEEFPIEKEQEKLLEWMNPKPEKSYLDIGCSTAIYARSLKRAEPEAYVVALDSSLQMLEEARIKAEADQTELLFLRADAREMPFFSNSFDGLMMGGTLNELTDELKVLFECRRVIKEEGVFFMMHLIRSGSWVGSLFQDSAEWSGLSFHTVKESNEMFERAGFKVKDQIVKGIVCFSKLVPM